jgi:hypothetical protein
MSTSPSAIQVFSIKLDKGGRARVTESSEYSPIALRVDPDASNAQVRNALEVFLDFFSKGVTMNTTVGPATLSYDHDQTSETVLAGLVTLHKYLETADRFTGNFSPDDQGNVKDWAASGNAGAAGGAHYVCTVAIDASAAREDVLTAVSGLGAHV